ncbi:hypothetical protein A9Q99_09145 [Gammaproteobacteria bacterium 45_16_T64]|nr:hypothetical protein A9Q99_09145 [Gammaproteobacteria bacterium 45_16_T64]
MNSNKIGYFKAISYSITTAFITMSTVHGGDLNLSTEALELRTSSEPNVVIIIDDSGSMDWEVVTRDFSNNMIFTAKQRDGSNSGTGDVTHRDADDSGTANCNFGSPTFGGYIYGVEFGTNNYTDNGNDCNTADDEAWRFRNASFNPMYFDPDKTYTPWAGVDKNGNEYGDIDITSAPDNPYDPSETVDLTNNNSDWQGTNRVSSDRNNDGVNDGFRYYVWKDADGDDLYDNGEETEYFIKDQSATVQQNFANWFSYYRSRDYVTKGAITESLKDVTNLRVGFATINHNATELEIESLNPSPTSGEKRDLFDAIYGLAPDNGTPLRNALYKTGQYYDCTYGNSPPSDNIFGSSAACPMLASPAGTCQQNYAILMTDGFYNGSLSSSVGNEDGNEDTDFDGGAYADSVSNTLADVAMRYYEDDQTTASDHVPTTSRDTAGASVLADADEMHQRMSTFTVGFGVDGTITSIPPNIDDAFAWPDPFSGTTSEKNSAKVDDLRHAAYNGRGNYLNAQNPTELADALSNIFEEIQSGIGAASAVAFNTQNLDTGAYLYRAFYNTKTHSGELQAIEIQSDGSILQTDIDNPAWQASDQYGSTTPAGRSIISYQRDGSSVGGIAFEWSSLSTDQQTLLNSPAPSCTASGGCYGSSTNTAVGDERVDYIRGDSTNEGDIFDSGDFFDRDETNTMLGDIVHSTPIFVGTPPYSNRDKSPYPTSNTYSSYVSAQSSRTDHIYVGANDGMLHAFDATNGNETFAYVPGEMYKILGDKTSPSYNHQFYVDLSPVVNDVYYTSAWHTILLGGYRGGGKGYFALDVTDPSAFSSTTTGKSKVMWEFTEEDDGSAGNSDLGYSYSKPSIVMTNASISGEQRWAAIFGNGYNSTSSDGDSAIYIVFIDGGIDGSWSASDFIKITTGYGKAESSDGTTPNGMGSPRVIDTDGNGTSDYIYAGDLQGNLFRFDISSTSSTNWSSSSNHKLLFQAEDSSGDAQPITIQPLVVAHPTEAGFVVITPSGSWITTDDAISEDIQSLYGIWDDKSSSPLVARSELTEQVFTNVTKTDISPTVTTRTLSSNDVVWSNTSGSKVKGWYIDFDVLAESGGIESPGERATQVKRFADLAFINTVLPKDPTNCKGAEGGWLLFFNPQTGAGPDSTVLDLDSDDEFDDSDNIVTEVDGVVSTSIVSGKKFDEAPGLTSVSGGTSFTQTADTQIITDDVSSGQNIGRISWREIFDEL